MRTDRTASTVTLREWAARYTDAVLAAAIAALFAFEIAVESAFGDDRAIAAVVAAGFCGSLLVRRRSPVLTLLTALGVVEFANLVAANQVAETGAFLLGLILALYSGGAHARDRAFLVAVAIVAVMIPLAAIEPGQATTPSDIAFFVVFFSGPVVLGRIIRWRRAQEKDLRGQAAAAEFAGRELAAAAVADERARMARELHDVVSHAVSVMLLQARGARKLLDTQPPGDPAVRAALDTIDAAGGTALDEMRRLLTVLRPDGLAPALGPQPSLRHLDQLVAGVRGAGLAVELDVSGGLDSLPPGVDVSAYRILQEALTNALRHAGQATARVRVGLGADELEIDVVDDGVGTTSPGSPGYGLVGMRERVAVHGGRLETGRGPSGGFALRARLPLRTGA